MTCEAAYLLAYGSRGTNDKSVVSDLRAIARRMDAEFGDAIVNAVVDTGSRFPRDFTTYLLLLIDGVYVDISVFEDIEPLKDSIQVNTAVVDTDHNSGIPITKEAWRWTYHRSSSHDDAVAHLRQLLNRPVPRLTTVSWEDRPSPDVVTVSDIAWEVVGGIHKALLDKVGCVVM